MFLFHKFVLHTLDVLCYYIDNDFTENLYCMYESYLVDTKGWDYMFDNGILTKEVTHNED